MMYRFDVHYLEQNITDSLTSMYNVIYDFSEFINIILSYFPHPPVVTLPVYEGREHDIEIIESCKNAIVAFVYPMLFKLNVQSVTNVHVDGRYLYVQTASIPPN